MVVSILPSAFAEANKAIKNLNKIVTALREGTVTDQMYRFIQNHRRELNLEQPGQMNLDDETLADRLEHRAKFWYVDLDNVPVLPAVNRALLIRGPYLTKVKKSRDFCIKTFERMGGRIISKEAKSGCVLIMTEATNEMVDVCEYAIEALGCELVKFESRADVKFEYKSMFGDQSHILPRTPEIRTLQRNMIVPQVMNSIPIGALIQVTC